MTSLHDRTFKELMKQRSFFEPFLKTYLPKGLLKRLNWDSVRFYKMGARHLEEKLQKEFEADVIYLAEIAGKTSFIWLHTEHQSTPDRYMTLRVINYQSAELLDYARQNPGKPLPLIVTILYYQGKKPWTYSLDLKDLFAEPELAMKYFAKPILVDLPSRSDQELMTHLEIGPIEIILKHIRRKEFTKGLNVFVARLRTVSGESRRTMLQYLIEVVDVSKEALLEAVHRSLPVEEGEFIMTLGERLREEGMHQGMQQGMQQGRQQGMQEGIQEGMQVQSMSTAKRLLLKGIDCEVVVEATGLPRSIVLQMQQSIRH